VDLSDWWSSLRDAQAAAPARPRADFATALRQAQEALAYLYGDEAMQAKALTKDEARRARPTR
jgi:hypothetical protein